MSDANALRSAYRIVAPTTRTGASVHAIIPTPVESFPTSPYQDPFVAEPSKLQPALGHAIQKAETRCRQAAGSFPVPFTIAEVTTGPPFPMAAYRDSEVDYIASEAKVAVLYAAYEMRAMVRRFAAANPLLTTAQFFPQMAAVQTPKFLHAVPLINSATNITDTQRKPSYTAMFSPTPNASGLIDFTSGYLTSLNQMIIPSNNSAAMSCIHGLGYSYLNGALFAAGFFDGTAGVWIGSDYQMGQVWPPVRAVQTQNDGPGTLTGTTHQMARILALILIGQLVDSASSSEMDGILRKAAQGDDTPWTARDNQRLPVAKFVYNKLGLGPKGSGPQEFRSEVSVIEDPVRVGSTYAVAWQNLLQTTPYDLSDMTSVILDTITEYEQ
jgi:hypothetical protein